MPDSIPSLLSPLENHRLEGLDAGKTAIYPFYEGRSICSLPSSICHWLGVPGLGFPPLMEDLLGSISGTFQHVILVVVDALGWNQWLQMLKNPDEMEICALELMAPITSIAPSTTAAALTTLWTGMPPAVHGVVGYEVWLKEFGVVANMILHSAASFVGDVGGLRRAGFQPETFLPVPTLGTHLMAHGVHPYAFQPLAISRSGLSTMLMSQTQVVPYQNLSDLWVSLEKTLIQREDEKVFSYVYWGDLDELSHRFGPQDERIPLEFALFSRMFARFYTRMHQCKHPRTLYLLTADHGQVSTPPAVEYDLREHPQLMDCLALPPTGESRMTYLFVHPGKEQFLMDYVEQTWPGCFIMLPAAQVIASGLLGSGSMHPRLNDRMGDWIVFPQKSGAYWWWANKENLLNGRHGGLTRDEMLVPLLGLEI